MVLILAFFIDCIKKIWEALSNFTVPFGDENIPFVQVIASCFMLILFSKIVASFFDLRIASSDLAIRQENFRQINKRKKEQQEAIKKINESRRFNEEQLSRHRYRVTVAKEGRKR